VCHTEDVSNATYHMLTACDQIGLAPLGSVTISGPAATSVHLKPLLDRIGVHADLLHVGDFKGAAEPLTRDAPSPQMLETLEAIVEQSYQTLIEGLVQGRKLSRNDAVAAVDRGLYVDGQARDAGLVDAVQPFEAFLVAQAEGKPWRRMQSDSSHPLADFAKIQRFLGMLPPKTPSGPHVAVVYAVGDIIDGHGQGIVGAREEIASRTLVAALRAIAANDDVKAVVLRIDSGGGSALASEQIWQAVHDLAERKPVVASMGSMAASGGYYIAAAATKIYARENTLTGSIGVVGGKLVFRDALENIGVRSYEVHRGERATLWSSLRPWSEAERATVQEMMEQTYEVFLERVGSGRKMERDAVHEIAQGRVWTGAAARERRLVDATGGLQEAVAEAARLGGIEPGQGLEVYPPEPSLRDILRSFGQVQSPLLSAWGGISAPSAPVVPGVPVGPVVMAGANATSAAMQLVQGVQALVGGAETYRLARVLASITTLIRLREDRVWAVSWVAPPL
jgi:protease-4